MHNFNTVFRAFDFNHENGLVCCAVANLVAIQDYYSGAPRTLFTLKGHQGRVNAVQWLGTDTIVSVGEDDVITVWRCSDVAGASSFESWSILQQEAKRHGANINYLSLLCPSQEERYFMTMCMNGNLHLWFFNAAEGKFSLAGTILFGKNLQEAFELTLLGPDHLLLAVGGYDSHIHIYTCRRSPDLTQDHSVSKHF